MNRTKTKHVYSRVPVEYLLFLVRFELFCRQGQIIACVWFAERTNGVTKETAGKMIVVLRLIDVHS